MAHHNYASLEELAAKLDAFEAVCVNKPDAIPKSEVMLHLTSSLLRLTAEVAELRERVSQLARPPRSITGKMAATERLQQAKQLGKSGASDDPQGTSEN